MYDITVHSLMLPDRRLGVGFVERLLDLAYMLPIIPVHHKMELFFMQNPLC